MVNSLIQDGDFDLYNNYQRVYQGSDEAGKAFAGAYLDQHVAWATEQGNVRWGHVYEMDPARWGHDGEGSPVPKIQDGKRELADSLTSRHYSWHAWGLPVLLAPIAYLFRGTQYLEAVMLICSGLSVVGAMYFFHMLVQPLTQNAQHTFLLVAAAFLGTPIWAYGRTLFTEPYLLFCVVGAFALYLRRQSGFWVGILIGVGILIKPAIAVVAVPLVLDSLFRRNWNRAIFIVIPCFGFSLLVLAGNHLMYGSYFAFPITSARFAIWQDCIEYIFSFTQGLFFLAPVVVAAIAGYPKLFCYFQRDAIIIFAGFFVYFTLCSSYDYGNGGYCYGPRYLVPVLPLLFASFPDIGDLGVTQTGNWTIAILLILSVEINFIAAVGCGNCWYRHPVELLLNATS
jgi:hypothetical protein